MSCVRCVFHAKHTLNVLGCVATQESGVQASVDEQVANLDSDSFDMHDDLLSDMALAGLPTVEPSCTFRSTQKSSADNEDEDDEESDESQQSSQNDVFDLVSDSNDEDDDEYETSIGDLLEDR